MLAIGGCGKISVVAFEEDEDVAVVRGVFGRAWGFVLNDIPSLCSDPMAHLTPFRILPTRCIRIRKRNCVIVSYVSPQFRQITFDVRTRDPYGRLFLCFRRLELVSQ